ncbi:MAG: DUF4282 domain-containing protein [Stackebrandtia sp.]
MTEPDSAPDTSSEGRPKGLFAALFDLSFKHFATPTVIQVYYVVGLVLLGLGVLAGVIGALVVMTSSPAVGFLQLLLTPIFGFGFLLLLRMFLELVSNLFRIGEDVRALRRRLERE